jgi:hypothetical protein
MVTCYQTWNAALKAPLAKPIFGDKDIRPLALEVYNSLAKREQGYAQCSKCDKALDEKMKVYLAACKAVLQEGEAVKRKLTGHPKALKVVDDFLDLITTEGQWELDDIEAIGLSGQNHAAQIMKKWDSEIVPNVKKHGLAPFAVISACKMHAQLLAIVKLYPVIQAAKQAVMGANTQVSRLDRLFVPDKIGKLRQKLKVWKGSHQGQGPSVDSVTKTLTEIEGKVQRMIL